jgi:pimeloyl-ACP methyl ester carboxylesterase
VKSWDVPTLIIHGDDDQIVPIGAAARLIRIEKMAASGCAASTIKEINHE